MDHTLALIGRIHREIKRQEILCFRKIWDWCIVLPGVFLGRGVEMEDLFQIGSIGLLRL